MRQVWAGAGSAYCVQHIHGYGEPRASALQAWLAGSRSWGGAVGWGRQSGQEGG